MSKPKIRKEEFATPRSRNNRRKFSLIVYCEPPLVILRPLCGLCRWSHEVGSQIPIAIVPRRLIGAVWDWTGTGALERSGAVLALVVPTLVEEEAAAGNPHG